MNEHVYEQVQDAIRRQLHLGSPATGLLGGRHWHYPVGTEYGLIVMRDSDCGLAKQPWTITPDEWARRVEQFGLWRQVDMWAFVRDDDPAAAEIAVCYADPGGCGRELHELRAEVARLRKGE